MKKKLIKLVLSVIALLIIMHGEYRYIMINQCPYLGKDGIIYIKIFNQVDEYYISEMEE